MTRGQPGAAPSRRAPVAEWPLRLDLLVNPYGPSIRVQEAIAAATDLHLPTSARESALRRALAEAIGIPPEWLTLTDGIGASLSAILNWRRKAGPAVLFPPTDISLEYLARTVGVETISIPRSHRFAVEVDPAADWALPRGATAFVSSPNDPTGTLLSAQDAVRLTRRCEIVVVDESHGEYGGRSLLPLVREFDNLIVLRTFETWAGLVGFPFAYVIAPPTLAGQIARFRPRAELPVSSLIAAEATLADLAYVRAAAHRVREEKSRLYRTLRKLNMLRPLPSWANFLLARVERGDAILLERELAERGILVHRPLQPELPDHLRISAVGPDSTLELKRALIAIAATL
ncbi:MAG: histidinol-phosphate aminotransferase [Thermomicrobiales bacterium]|nr:histidinol-phosphate aminotransferase [Thermomicrobiales bacterium]MEA2596151.1 histidinol-phosphate aminotransferase [Thermomicrobiales bacterium]